jgi:hypothetical protein
MIYTTIDPSFLTAQELFYGKDILTKEEAQCIIDFMPAAAKANLFFNEYTDEVLNMNVYSEYDHDCAQFHREVGF